MSRIINAAEIDSIVIAERVLGAGILETEVNAADGNAELIITRRPERGDVKFEVNGAVTYLNMDVFKNEIGFDIRNVNEYEFTEFVLDLHRCLTCTNVFEDTKNCIESKSGEFSEKLSCGRRIVLDSLINRDVILCASKLFYAKLNGMDLQDLIICFDEITGVISLTI